MFLVEKVGFGVRCSQERIDDFHYDVTGRQNTLFTNFSNISLDKMDDMCHMSSILSNEMLEKFVNIAFCPPVMS